MWRKQARHIIVLLISIILLSSCSKFRKIQRSESWEVKYKAAMEYYEEEDYYHASILFEEVLPIIMGTEEAEKAQFFFAYSHFHQGSHLLSAHYFKTFYDTYRRSEYALEALFMHAYSLYLESPKYNLDQTSTREAINAMQNFINRYPRSEYVTEANDIIDQLQYKLAKKAYEKAKQYYKLGRLKAAVIAFENFQRDFPDSQLNEEISYLQIDAQYQYAVQSILSRQRERFVKAKEFYEQFIDSYGNSKYAREAEKIYVNILDQLQDLKDTNI